MKDILGNDITPGVLLAYPRRQGSHCWLNVMRVESIGADGRVSGPIVSGGKRRVRIGISNAVVTRWSAPTTDKTELCPANHGSQCCGRPDICRVALGKQP